MAYHVLVSKDQDEFFKALKNRDKDLVIKLVKSVLHAIKTKKKTVDIFQVIFKNMKEYTFSLDKDQYKECLSNCLDDMVKYEEYELCANIRDFLNKKIRRPKKVNNEDII